MVKPREIDLSKVDGYTSTDAEAIIERLERDGFYKPDLIFRGFNGEMLEIMLKHGTDSPDSDMIFCGDEEDLREGGSMNALEYAFKHSKPALAVYDGPKLTEGDCYQRKRFINRLYLRSLLRGENKQQVLKSKVP